MKVLLAIINSDDAPVVIQRLMKEHYSITKLSSTGGFLSSGNTTILIGLEEALVQNAIDIISNYSKSRKQIIPTTTELGMGFFPAMPVEVMVGGATIFVLNAERFEKV